MPQIVRLSAEDRDDLVAYLDGELEGEGGRRIEQALSTSPVARHEVEMLTRTWDLLDLLPQDGPAADFTQRTVTAALALDDSTALADRPAVIAAKRAGVLLGWAGLIGGAAAVGYLSANDWVPRDTDPLVDDYPILEDLPRLRDAHSVDFLRELDRSGVLGDLPPDAFPALPRDPDPPAAPPADPPGPLP